MPTPVSTFIWNGFTLAHRTELRESDLDPTWALVRARKELEQAGAKTSGLPADGDLRFDEPLAQVAISGVFLPYMISGDIRAERSNGAVVVTATTSLASTFVGFLISAVVITIIFLWRFPALTMLRWVLLALVTAVTALHLWQTANALRRMTTAATAL